MKENYYVYTVKGNYFLSRKPLLPIQSKKKYTLIEAQREAIRRMDGKEVDRKEVKEYITQNIYGTKRWPEYINLIGEIGAEREELKYEIVKLIQVTMKNGVDPEDERLLFLLKQSLLDKSIPVYRGLQNPIIRIEEIGEDIIPQEIDELFNELIKNKAWYKQSGYERNQAYYDKKKHEEGELPVERKREYLMAAGYEQVQKELWRRKL